MRIGLGRNEYIDFNPRYFAFAVDIWCLVWILLYKDVFYILISIFVRPTVPYCNCFPLYIGRLKITVFHFLFSCTMIFSMFWVSQALLLWYLNINEVPVPWCLISHIWYIRGTSSTVLYWRLSTGSEPWWLRSVLLTLSTFVIIETKISNLHPFRILMKISIQQFLMPFNRTTWPVFILWIVILILILHSVQSCENILTL